MYPGSHETNGQNKAKQGPEEVRDTCLNYGFIIDFSYCTLFWQQSTLLATQCYCLQEGGGQTSYVHDHHNPKTGTWTWQPFGCESTEGRRKDCGYIL